MTSSKRNFTMNDLKLPDILFDVYNGGFFHCTDLIKPSYKYLETMRATMNNWSIVQGQIKRKKLDSDTAVRKMTDSLKEYNKLPYQKQLLVLTCIARNLPLTVVRASETDVRLVDILTIDTGLDIGTFVHTFVNLVETMVNESESSAEVKTDGSFVFALRLNFNDRKTTYKTCYISIDDSEAKNIIKQSSSSVLLPNSDGFRLSEDETTMIKHYSLNSNFIKVEERLRNDFGLKLELKTEGSGENEIDVCLLLNMNSFPIRTENLYTIVLFTALEELKGRKMTKTPKQDNKTCRQVEDEYAAKPIHTSQEITQDAANNSIPMHDVGNAVMWKFTDIFAAVKFAISSIETSSGSNVLIANLCEFLETKPGFVNLLKTYVQNVEKYNRIITIRGMNSCLDVLEYNTKHGTDYDYVPNPGSLMEPRYGWEHIDPVTGASSFRDHPQSPSISETQPEEIKDTIVPESKITNGELTKLHDRLSALENWVGVKIAEHTEMIRTYAERAVFHGNGMFSIVKVAKLPNGRIPNAMYLVGEPNSDKFDLYVTGMNGELRALNTGKDEKEITRAICKTLEISDPNAVKAWIKQTQAVAANIETYYKHRESDSEMETSVVTEKTSIQGMLEDTKSALKQIAADQDRIARNSISGAMVGNVINTKTKSKEPDTGMELTGWRELSALAKHLNIDLSDIYVFLTSDGKVEIREHVMFPSKEYLDQIGNSPIPPTSSPSNTHMSNSALIHNVETLYMSLYGHREIIDASVIARCSSSVSDMFFAVERELVMRTDEAVRMLAHAGYKVNVSYMPIPDAAPLCTRMFQIGKDGNNLSFAFYDSIPVRA